MSDITTPAVAAGDERLAYRSIFQRIFIRPEVGAMIGAIGIWAFFWAASETFGTAGGTFGWLDIAATLGIMAVAVSMLMIGGEFDLSSGAMTGAMGILIILMVKETGDLGGLGIPLAVAIPLSLAVALGIGYVNGVMVERTGQPSFIVTLGTFFALKGLKLGLSKRFVDQIQVGTTDEAPDFDFFRPIFAAEWARNDHQFAARDFFYIVLISIGVIVAVLAICELWFRRREQLNAAGLPVFVAGLAIGGGGGIALHYTDGFGVNALLAAVIAIGVLVGMHGFATWRYEPIADRGTVQLSPHLVKRMTIGVGAVVAGCAAGIILRSSPSEAELERVSQLGKPTTPDEIIFPFTVQGVRAILLVGLAAGGFVLLALASHEALKVNAATKRVATSVMAGAVGLFAATVFVDSTHPKFRGALFSVLLFTAVLLLGWAHISSRFQERRFADRHVDRLGMRALVVAALAIIAGVAIRLLFTVQAEIDAGIPPSKTSIRLFWFVAFTAAMVWVLARTRFGSWTFAVGGNKEAARQVGVPAARTKTQLFMLVAFAAWFVGLLVAFRINSIQSNFGDGEEFEFIIAAVVGGTLLTGGYGTAFGGAIGAMIMAMPVIGIASARWNTDWRFLMVGVILLLAVVANRFIRTKAEGVRR